MLSYLNQKVVGVQVFCPTSIWQATSECRPNVLLKNTKHIFKNRLADNKKDRGKIGVGKKQTSGITMQTSIPILSSSLGSFRNTLYSNMKLQWSRQMPLP